MRGVRTGGRGVAVGGLIAALLFALPALAANPPGLVYSPSQTLIITPSSGVAGVCEDGNTAVAIATTSGGTAGVQITGTWTGTIGFYVRVGSLSPAGGTAAAYQAAQATPYPAGGSAVSTTTANGTWQIPVAGAQAVCVAFTTAASTGTATITANVTPASSASGTSSGGGGGALATWTVLATVVGPTTSADIATGSVKEIQIVQTGAAGPSGTPVLNVKMGTAYYPLLTAGSASGGNNNRMIMSLGPYANIAEGGSVASGMVAYTYTIPPTIQFVPPSNGTYTIYGR